MDRAGAGSSARCGRRRRASTTAPGGAGENATQLANQALESLRSDGAPPRLRDWPWKRIARAGAVGLLALVTLALVNTVLWDEGRVARAELGQLSPYLSDGKRSGEGTGPAFVGTLDDRWSELAAAEQAKAAERLVQALRKRGVRAIMIYDDDQRLRIQALGSQPPRVIPE